MLESVQDILVRGGLWIMLPLCMILATLWYALGFRYLSLRRGSVQSVRNIHASAIRGELRGDGLLSRSARACAAMTLHPRTAASQLHAVFSTYEDEAGRGASLVRTLVMVSPLAGLLGTVIGMIETFQSLGQMAMFARSGGISWGISQALITTQFGLSVAIPGLILGRSLDRREERLLEELDELKGHFLSNVEVAA